MYSQYQHNVSGLRRRTWREYDDFGDDFYSDEIFRTFFGQNDDGDVFRRTYVYSARTAGADMRVELSPVARRLVLFLQVVMLLLIIILVFRPFFGA